MTLEHKMNIDKLIKAAMNTLKPGQEFHVRAVGTCEKPVGDPIKCKVIAFLGRPRQAYPILLAHVGCTQDVTCLYVTTDVIEGAETVTLIGVAPSDAEMDYKYPAVMLSGEWEGALFVVLD